MCYLLQDKRIKIVVSEPWNFKSKDGDNVIYVKKIKENDYGIVVENLSDFKGATKYLLLVERDKDGTYNIYRIDEKFDLKETVYKQKNFLLIGSI